jgi:hypothetical protein
MLLEGIDIRGFPRGAGRNDITMIEWILKILKILKKKNYLLA